MNPRVLMEFPRLVINFQVEPLWFAEVERHETNSTSTNHKEQLIKQPSTCFNVINIPSMSIREGRY